jgi:G3E family GTPase
MSQRRVTPILLITGFLGSGKTSLLARWLRSPMLSGAIAIINELGEVGIDDRLIETSTETSLLLENGCACCTAGEDLTATLERLFWRQLHREIPPVSWIVIETTGVADPRSILAMIANNDLLTKRYRVAGVVTTFDARNGPRQLAANEECRHQLTSATTIVVTKLDVVSTVECQAAEAALKRSSPNVPVLWSNRASVSIEDVIESATQDSVLGLSQITIDGSHFHNHEHHSHLENITTAFLSLEERLNATIVAKSIKTVGNRFDDALLRLKGIISIDGHIGLTGIQYELGVVELTLIPARANTGRLGLTIISRGSVAQEIATMIRDELDLRDATYQTQAVPSVMLQLKSLDDGQPA